MYQSQFIKQVQTYRGEEIVREVSVYRYTEQQPYNPAEIHRKISTNLLRKTSFGIMEQLPTEDHSIRTLWAKLGQRTFPIVDEEGQVTYWQVDRVIVSSAVVEFFNDDSHLGLIIFGGSSSIHNELLSTL